MPYKDPAVQRQYQRQWWQNRRQQRTHARQEHLLTLAVWHTQVQNVHGACKVAQQTLRQIEPDLIRDAMAGRMRVPVAEIMWLLGGKPCRRTQSWRRTIRTQRIESHDELGDSPSLHPQVPALLQAAYPDARKLAADQTHLPLATFPEVCPWTVEQVLDEDFWPEITP